MRLLKTILISLLLSVHLFAEIKVSSFATGMGTDASPWVGWDTAIPWAADTQYRFSCDGAGAPGNCYFRYVDSPNFMKHGIALIGEAGVVLLHAGVGNAVVFDNPTGWTFNVRMENFIIQGNAGTTNGILARGLRRGHFDNISVKDVTEAGIRCEACVTNIFDNFGVTAYEWGVFAIRPKYGVVLVERATKFADGSTTNIFNNLVVEGVSTQAWIISDNSPANQINGGTSEGNLGTGGLIRSQWNKVSGHWFEGNGGTDLALQNRQNTVENVISTRKLSLDAGGQNRILGGRYKDIYIHPYVNISQFEGMEWTGVFSDNNGSTTSMSNVGPAAAGGYQLSARFANVITLVGTLQHGAIVNTNCVANSNFQFVAFEHFTLANPTFASNGQRVTWRIGQGNAGGWIITFGNRFRAKGGVFPVLSTISGAYDYITAIYNSSSNTWDIQ